MFLPPPRFCPSYSVAGAVSRAPVRSMTSRAGLLRVKSWTSTAPRRSITTSTLPGAGTTLTAFTSPSRAGAPIIPGLAPGVSTNGSSHAARRTPPAPAPAPPPRCRAARRCPAWGASPAPPAARSRAPAGRARGARSFAGSRGLRRRLLRARRPGRRGRRLHERADHEARLEQRTHRVAHELLRPLRRRLERHVLRHDDPRQARDVGQELAHLVVVTQDLHAVAVGIERRARLDRQRLEPPDVDAADFGLGRDVVDQRRHLVLLGDEATHQAEHRLVLLDLAPQVLHGAARQVRLGAVDDRLEAVRLRALVADSLGHRRVHLGPEEVAPRRGDDPEGQHDLAALVRGNPQRHDPYLSDRARGTVRMYTESATLKRSDTLNAVTGRSASMTVCDVAGATSVSHGEAASCRRNVV